VVALVAQHLDTCQDGLLDLIMGRAGGRVVVLAGEAGGVDRVAEPEVEPFGGMGVGPTPRTTGGVWKPMTFSQAAASWPYTGVFWSMITSSMSSAPTAATGTMG
jgi:hypothetical protein